MKALLLSTALSLGIFSSALAQPLTVLPYTYTIDLGADGGSGISIATRDHYSVILTCHHVVSGESKIRVLRNDHFMLPARVIADDPQDDLALIRVEEVLPIAPRYLGPLVNGEALLVSGSPLGKGPLLTQGFVGPLDTDGTQMGTAEAWPGSSGGGAWVLRGDTWMFVGTIETVGMYPVTFKGKLPTPYYQIVGGVSYFVPENVIEKFLHKAGY